MSSTEVATAGLTLSVTLGRVRLPVFGGGWLHISKDSTYQTALKLVDVQTAFTLSDAEDIGQI